jgi:maleylpyruvate isomerase
VRPKPVGCHPCALGRAHPVCHSALSGNVGYLLARAIKNWYGHWIQTGFTAIEDLIEEGSAYCVGNKPTIADAFLVPQVYNARRFDVPLDEFPKILSIDAKCNRLDAFSSSAPENQNR